MASDDVPSLDPVLWLTRVFSFWLMTTAFSCPCRLSLAWIFTPLAPSGQQTASSDDVGTSSVAVVEKRSAQDDIVIWDDEGRLLTVRALRLQPEGSMKDVDVCVKETEHTNTKRASSLPSLQPVFSFQKVTKRLVLAGKAAVWVGRQPK